MRANPAHALDGGVPTGFHARRHRPAASDENRSHDTAHLLLSLRHYYLHYSWPSLAWLSSRSSVHCSFMEQMLGRLERWHFHSSF